MPLMKIEIPDISDCETCQKRHGEQWELLQDERCNLLTDLTCPECGRTYSLFVIEEPTDAD